MKERLIIRADGEGGYFTSLGCFGARITLMTEVVEDYHGGHRYTRLQVIEDDLWDVKFYHSTGNYDFEYLVEVENVRGLSNAKKMVKTLFREHFETLAKACGSEFK